MERPAFPRSSAPSLRLSRACETGAESDLRLACATLRTRMSQDLAQPAPLSTSRDAARRGAPVGTLAAYLCIGTWLTMVST